MFPFKQSCLSNRPVCADRRPCVDALFPTGLENCPSSNQKEFLQPTSWLLFCFSFQRFLSSLWKFVIYVQLFNLWLSAPPLAPAPTTMCRRCMPSCLWMPCCSWLALRWETPCEDSVPARRSAPGSSLPSPVWKAQLNPVRRHSTATFRSRFKNFRCLVLFWRKRPFNAWILK